MVGVKPVCTGGVRESTLFTLRDRQGARQVGFSGFSRGRHQAPRGLIRRGAWSRGVREVKAGRGFPLVPGRRAEVGAAPRALAGNAPTAAVATAKGRRVLTAYPTTTDRTGNV